MKWFTPPFERFINYLREADQLLHLCLQGITHVSKVLPLAEALANLDRIQNPDNDSTDKDYSLEETRERAELAQGEIDKGFPLLHAHIVVGVWGALEATITDFLVLWLINEPNALKSEVFSKVKIPLAEFEIIDKEERMHFLIDEAERGLRSQFKAGVSRFEALFSAIGLSGSLDEELKKTLFEMFHIRNIIVHRASIVDRRFAEACPWLNYSVGDTIVLQHKDWVRYREAITYYGVAIINRVAQYSKKDEAEPNVDGG